MAGTTTEAELFGFGLTIPFQRAANDFAAAGGLDLIRSNVAQIIGTRIGELPWRPRFGSELHKLRSQNNDRVRAELARVFVNDALSRWEPRVAVKGVEVSTKTGPDGENTILYVKIRYDVVSLASGEILFPDQEQSLPVAA